MVHLRLVQYLLMVSTACYHEEPESINEASLIFHAWEYIDSSLWDMPETFKNPV